jgi:hypothetical protein
MTTLTVAHAAVKPTRKPTRRFGEGILSALPVHSLPCSFADAAWWAEESERIAEDRHYDDLAALSMTTDRLENGCCL